MKKLTFPSPTLIGSIIACFLSLSLVVISCCDKEPEPTIYGKWETVQSFGYKWEFEIEKGGDFCRRLPEAFGTTSFCYPFEVSGSTLTLNAPTVEIWEISFVGFDVAEITVTAPDGEIFKMILKRLP